MEGASRTKVALIQMDSSTQKEENLKKAQWYIEEAAASGAKVVCFPELMPGEAENSRKEEMQETLDGMVVSTLQELAEKKGVYIHSGSMYEKNKAQSRCYNTSVWISPLGRVEAVYRKLHLFDVRLEDGTACMESNEICPGKQIVTADTAFGKIGFATCYDIRFPELFRKMALEGVTIFLVAASFTESTGKDHWEPLLRARAIENGCYVLATNQIGKKQQYTAFGNSMIVDPWGTVIARAANRETIVYGEISQEDVRKVRKQIPVLKNRRADLYGGKRG